MAPPFALLTARSDLHESDELRERIQAYESALAGIGALPWAPSSLRPSMPIAVFLATGGTERIILDRLGQDRSQPIVLIAHPGHNSLPAAMETLARLQQLGLRGSIHYLESPSDARGLQAVEQAVQDVDARRFLAAARIGLVGEPSSWLVASSPPMATVTTVWGPKIVPLSVDELCVEPDTAELQSATAFANQVRLSARRLVEPLADDLLAAARVHALLNRIVMREHLDAIAVRCFDLVTRKRTTGCLALAQLNDDGVVAGCEGDLVSTVVMLWLRKLLGATPWMANPARVDFGRGTFTLAHCTVPRSLVDSHVLRSHFESGLGVGIQGQLRTGPVTLVRAGGLDADRLRVCDATLLRNTDDPALCRTQVEVEVGRAMLEEWLAEPLGNHVVVVEGRHARRLRRWHDTMIAGRP